MFLTLTLPLPQFLDLYTSPLHIAVPGGKGMRVSMYFKHGKLDESLVSVEGQSAWNQVPEHIRRKALEDPLGMHTGD